MFLSGLALLALGAFLSFEQHADVATITYVAGLLAIALANMEKFKLLKGLGFEAVLREKIQIADRKIEETDNAIRRLRELMKPTAELMFTLVARGGRYVGVLPRAANLRLVGEIENELKLLGMQENEIEAAKRELHFFTTLDLAVPVRDAVLAAYRKKDEEQLARTDQLPTTLDGAAQRISAEVQQIRKHIREASKKVENLYLADMSEIPDVLEHAIDDESIFSSNEQAELRRAIAEELADLHHYVQNHSFRRIDTWLQGSKD